jgi:hypothetical protein
MIGDGDCGEIGGMKIGRGNEVLGENLPQRHFVHHKIHMPIIIIFYYLVCEAIGTAATPGLLCQPWVIVKMIVEKQMECRVAGEAEVPGENLPPRHFVHHKTHIPRSGFEPGPPRWEASD